MDSQEQIALDSPYEYHVVTPETYNPKNLNTTALNIMLNLPGMSSTLSEGEILRVRAVAITASGLSIIVGIVAISALANYDRRKRVFRHELILFLILCDFFKAIILLLYPLILLCNHHFYTFPALIHILGWGTQFVIEGADFAIFFFAIHFGLLIFKPNWKWKNRKTGNIEGGLYKYKQYIWIITLVLPALMASLVFVNYNKLHWVDPKTVNIVVDNMSNKYYFKPRIGGYKPWVAWCYLPGRNLWYKYMLSWGPRYFLILFIVGLYCSIYIYVTRETAKIKEQLRATKPKSKKAKLTWKDYLKRAFFGIFYILSAFLSMSMDVYTDSTVGSNKSFTTHSNGSSFTKRTSVTSEPNRLNNKGAATIETSMSPEKDQTRYDFKNEDSITSSNETDKAKGTLNVNFDFNQEPKIKNDDIELKDFNNLNNDLELAPETVDKDNREFNKLQREFQKENYDQLKKRRDQIERTVRSVFIYPISYILIWLFPIAADISQNTHEKIFGPIMWLTYLDTFIRPLPCLVHSFVFIFKEKPWQFSWNRVEKKILLDKYMLRGEIGEDEMVKLCHTTLGKRGWYYRSTWNKRNCWKYHENPFKRGYWYVRRFLKCIFHFRKVSFYDNCNDEIYWNRYYYLDTVVPYPNSVISTAFGSESGSNSSSMNGGTYNRFSANNSVNDNYKQFKPSKQNTDTLASQDVYSYSSHRVKLSKEEDIIYVPFWWQFLHRFPMLGGIDLDELNRSVKLRYTNDEDDFTIPGLAFALKSNSQNNSKSDNINKINKLNNIRKSTTHTVNNNHNLTQFKPIVNVTDVNKAKPISNRQVKFDPQISGAGQSKNSFKHNRNNNEDEDNDEENSMDLLAFLNG